jgi:hypothetical protein
MYPASTGRIRKLSPSGRDSSVSLRRLGRRLAGGEFFQKISQAVGDHPRHQLQHREQVDIVEHQDALIEDFHPSLFMLAETTPRHG